MLSFSTIEGAELAFCLASKIVSINKEKDSSRRGVIQKPIACQTCKICFTRASGQYSKALFLSLLYRLLELCLCAVLAVTQAALIQSRQSSIFRDLAYQLQHLLRRMHLGKLNVVAVWLQHILEVNLFAVCKVYKRNLVLEPQSIPVLWITGVVLCLLLYIFSKRVFLALSFDDGYCLIVDKKQIVAFRITLHKGFFYSRCATRDILIS